MNHVWDLPGPSGFVEQVRSAVTGEKHVVIQFPRLHPEGLCEAVAERLRLTWDFRRLEYRAGTGALEFLSGFLGLPDNTPPRALPTSPQCVGSALWVDGIEGSSWREWRSLIVEFAAATKDLGPGKCGVLILPIVGLPPSAAPPGEVGLERLRWQGCVDTHDTLLYAGHRMRSLGHPPPLRQLLSATIARLALWDLGLAERLSQAAPKMVLSPLTLLKQYGAELGWSEKEDTRWADGSLHMVDGCPRDHSAHPAVTRSGLVLESRIWSAQASVLFPLLEDRKLGLLPKLKKYLSLPCQVSGKTIDRAEKLELTQIHRMVQGHRHVPQKLLRQLRSLLGVRNHLAHLEPLNPASLLDSDVLRTV